MRFDEREKKREIIFFSDFEFTWRFNFVKKCMYKNITKYIKKISEFN